jgi:hypothetical protein
MDSITITTGVKRVCINGDETRVIEFNPSDVVFAERFYELMAAFKAKEADYLARSRALDEAGDEQAPEALALLREVCEFLRAQIDRLFGAGTSQKAFGDTLEFAVFEQFFEGMTPFIQADRARKVERYARPKQASKGRKVMK